MNSNKKTIIALGAFFLFMILAYFVYVHLSENYLLGQEPGIQSGESTEYEALDFEVLDENGDKVSFEDFEGKPVVINFWASWCPPCKAEMPFFNEAYQEYNDEVEFVMIDLADGSRETISSAKEFIKNQGYILPIYFDTTQKAAISYGVSSIPSSFFISSDSKVVYSHIGSMSKEQLIEAISKIN